MAVLTIQIDTGSTGPSVGDLNQILQGTAANAQTKPLEVVTGIQNLMDGLKGGLVSGIVTVTTSTGAGTISGLSGGIGPATLNLK